MVARAQAFLARALYGAIFVVGVPGLLVAWANATEDAVRLPAIQSAPAGIVLTAIGVASIAAGMHALIVHGHGLPMNAFPPKEFVSAGIYRFLSNPIYVGFGLTCFGVALASGSASGLWLVSPVASLAAAALVFGYERRDLERRFGSRTTARPLLSLPSAEDEPPTNWHRAAVYLYVLLPWLVTYYAVQALGRPPDAFTVDLPFELAWPVVEWTEMLYVSAYFFIPITPLVVRSQRPLHRFAVTGALATAIVAVLWITIPVVASHRPFEPTTTLGRLLAFERAGSARVAAFPAFHVLWALIAADAWHSNARTTGRSAWSWAGWIWAALITVSCITTGMHALIDLVAAMLLYLLLAKYAQTRIARPRRLAAVITVLVACVWLRIWWLGGSITLVGALILIFIGLAGFVEESFRIRPHALVAGLPVTQWAAIGCVLAGVAISALA